MLIGIVGKPSAGKSTLLNALCLTDAKMGNYPFTTIKANRGVALVRVKCPCIEYNVTCEPRTGKCIDGTRYVPVELLDVAGLVPGASTGKGMGNQFLDDLRQADALIHVVDASGTTDEEGNLVDEYDPVNDIRWLNEELDAWIYKIVFEDWGKSSRKLEQDPTKVYKMLQDRLSGLGATISDIKKAHSEANLIGENPTGWTEEQLNDFASELRKRIFPLIIACNKMDKSQADKHIEDIKKTYPDLPIKPISGLAELTLRRAEEDGLIDYPLGSNKFTYLKEDTKSERSKVLDAIQERLLDSKGSTGVTELLEYAVFEILEMISVFPVEDQSHLTDQDGRVLPDVFLVKKGTTAKEFARKIHSDLADNFLHGILVTDNNKRVSAEHELEHGDILKIVSTV